MKPAMMTSWANAPARTVRATNQPTPCSSVSTNRATSLAKPETAPSARLRTLVPKPNRSAPSHNTSSNGGDNWNIPGGIAVTLLGMRPLSITSQCREIVYALSLCSAALVASADNPSATFEFLNEPRWISNASAFHTTVRIEGAPAPRNVTVEYTQLDSESSTAHAKQDASDTTLYGFKLPLEAEAGPGMLNYTVVVSPSNDPSKSIRSETRTIPVALEQELDITGDAAIALLYPLGGDEYTVRYVPCCNIFGGITIATRVPVNPEESSEGLPEKILSDFLILSPDGLSASTMGMYMDFEFGPERFEGVTPALYEFNGREWVEFSTYEVDPDRGYLSMHCPNGGTFVIAAKP